MADETNALLDHWAKDINDPHFIRVVREAWEIYKTKGMDYTQGQWAEDRLANFRASADFSNTSMAQAWGNLFAKGLHAIQRYIKYGKLESEPIEGRIFDAINYMILLLLIVEEEEKERNSPLNIKAVVEEMTPHNDTRIK